MSSSGSVPKSTWKSLSFDLALNIHSPTPALLDRCNEVAQQESVLREGVCLRQGYGGQGGAAGQERQHKLGRLFVRERSTGKHQGARVVVSSNG